MSTLDTSHLSSELFAPARQHDAWKDESEVLFSVVTVFS